MNTQRKTHLESFLARNIGGLVKDSVLTTYKSRKNNITVTLAVRSDEDIDLVEKMVADMIQDYALENSLGVNFKEKATSKGTQCYEYFSLDNVPLWITAYGLTPKHYPETECELCGSHDAVWIYTIPVNVLNIKLRFKALN